MVVMDEADFHILDHLFAPKNCYFLVAVSATKMCREGGLEESLLRELSFTIVDSKIRSSIED